MIEIYKDIEGYEGLYEVSNLGNVKSLNKQKGRILKPAKNDKGYLRVTLCKQGKVKKYFIHRLVAQAFLPNPDNLPQVNHKDENKTNNAASNLEFCNAKYNSNYGTHTERSALSRSKQVMCVETGSIYTSTNEVERELGFRNQNIGKCCLNKLKTAYGYTWRYV